MGGFGHTELSSMPRVFCPDSNLSILIFLSVTQVNMAKLCFLLKLWIQSRQSINHDQFSWRNGEIAV